MRLTCPLCGERDSREFSVLGSARLLDRPAGSAGLAAFHNYVNIRDNVAGLVRELWHHEMGCRSWLVVTRNNVTHAVIACDLASEVEP